jgi:phosphoserine phosphatase
MSVDRSIVAEHRETLLVLQGSAVDRSDIESIAKLARATAIINTAPNVFKLRGAKPFPELAERCRVARLDYAFVPAELKLSYFKLVAMDMDSTLINIESLDEIADYLGLKKEIAAITERSMNGEIDFSESLRYRVALLRGLDAGALERVYDERLELNPGAEKFIATLHKRDIKTMLVSGGFTFFTERLKRRLGLNFAYGNELEIIDGTLTGAMIGPLLDPDRKAEKLLDVVAMLSIDVARTIAIGDGANDRAMFDSAGTGIAYHGKAVLRPHATYCIDHVGLDGILNLFA